MAPLATGGALVADWPEAEEEVRAVRPPSWELRRRMLEAVQYGDLLQLRALVRQGALLDALVPELPAGRGNLLDWALHHKQPAAAVRLLKIADADCGTRELGDKLARGVDSAVYTAASHGFVDALRALLERGAVAGQRSPAIRPEAGQHGHAGLPTPAPLASVEPPRRSALRAAAEGGHAEAVALLVKAGAWSCEEQRDRVLECARNGGFLGVLPGDSVFAGDVPPVPAKQLRAELQEAILHEDMRAIEAAVVRGASLLADYRSDRAAAHSNHQRCDGHSVVVLSARRPGVKVNPLDWAALEGCPSAALRLMELQFWLPAPPADRLGRTCRCAVHVAALRGNAPHWLALLRGLLLRGADSGQCDPHGRSALHLAVMRGNVDAAELLMEHGAWEKEAQRNEVLRLALSQRVAVVVEAGGIAAPGGTAASTVGSADAVEVPASAAASCSAGSVASSAVRALPSSEPAQQPAAPSHASALADAQTQDELQECRARLTNSLAKAVRYADLAAIGALLARGADLAVEVDLGYGLRGNLVDLAVWHEREGTALALLDAGDQRGLGLALAAGARHAVFWAVRHDYLGVLQALLERRADAGQSDEVCGSALRFAVEQRRANAASALLGAGAWAKEPEKDRVLAMLHEQGLLHFADVGRGRGVGLADAGERERLVAAALGAEIPRDALALT